MSSNTRKWLLLGVLMIAVMFGWQWLIVKLGWVKPPPPPPPSQEAVMSMIGGMASGVHDVAALKRRGIVEQPAEAQKEQPKPQPVPEAELGELIAMGGGDDPYYLQPTLNTRGGSVQEVILTRFYEADRGGLEEKKPDGKLRLLHLVPGVKVRRAATLKEQREIDRTIPELKEGPYERLQTLIMNEPSFLMFHYDKPGDLQPLATLGNKRWDWLKDQSDIDPNKDEQRVVFQTDLGEPHNVRITKTFTLKRREYHIGLQVDISRIPGKHGPAEFRYQLTGAHGLPIEGEWYTTTYRNAIVGFSDGSRRFEDAASIRRTEGGDRIFPGDGRINYAAVAVQYFASAIAVDDEQEKRDFVKFVRATPADLHPPVKPGDGKEVQYFDFLDDITVRAITEPVNPDMAPSHKYLLYHGPIKVRLLRELPAGSGVDPALVDRYLDQLQLQSLTDAPLTAIGRFFNTFFLVDFTIFITNLIHRLLWLLDQIVPSLGICILLVTVIVRGAMFPFTRKQSAKMQATQAKMAKFQPELKKLKEKYANEPQQMHAEYMKLMREHGINPFAAMGGCLPLLIQTPIIMGLYYAIQENVFLRLDPFLWFPNLAAPDMLAYWSESIPIISLPGDLGGSFYLGPYFNLLPLVAVGLMLVQQIKMMPKSDDPQMQSQQTMMKIMTVLMGLFFYKVAAGLCVYFITSTLWGLVERRLTKRLREEGALAANTQAPPNGQPPRPLRPPGWLGRKKLKWQEKWNELLEQAQKQQEFRRREGPEPPGAAGKKKKKRR